MLDDKRLKEIEKNVPMMRNEGEINKDDKKGLVKLNSKTERTTEEVKEIGYRKKEA